MQKNPTRTLIIWVITIIALVNIYPTLGWMTLEDDAAWLAMTAEEREGATPDAGTRQARLLQWEAEDDARAKVRPGYFAEMSNGFRRWSEFDRSKVITLGLDLQGGCIWCLGSTSKTLTTRRWRSIRVAKYR